MAAASASSASASIPLPPCCVPVVHYASLPDFTITQQSSVSFTVTNIGGGIPQRFAIAVDTPMLWHWYEVPTGLAPGASITFAIHCLGWGLTATIDPGNQVAESNENNNSAPLLYQGCFF